MSLIMLKFHLGSALESKLRQKCIKDMHIMLKIVSSEKIWVLMGSIRLEFSDIVPRAY